MLKGKRFNVIAVLKDEATGRILKRIKASNLVTNEGDLYYAKKGAGETPIAFDTMYLGDTGAPTVGKASNYASLTFIAGSNKLVKATYPKTDDSGDADNTGDAVDAVTWTFEYTGVDGNFVGITEAVIALPAAPDKVLCHFSFGGAFTKDASTTLKVMVNHTANGI